MNKSKVINTIYYQLKPLIPREVQIWMRRRRAALKRKLYEGVWPINEQTSGVPEGWTGWPQNKKFALVLIHDVDTAKGHERCRNLLEIEKESGFRSSFNFVPEGYEVSSKLRRFITDQGFGVGVHGLKHDNKLFSSIEAFKERAKRINAYLADWECRGFTSPCMYHNLDWIHGLEIDFDTSTFDTDPFEPQSDGVCTIYPFWVAGNSEDKGYVELPYTLPQDHCLFIILQEKDISIWKKKLDWIAERGGMALLNTHPDYMAFKRGGLRREEYPVENYIEFIDYVKSKYRDQYWQMLSSEIAKFWKENMVKKT